MRAKDGKFSAEDLRRVLFYDPATGIFRWRELPHKSASNIRIGDIAGFLENTGYVRITLWGRRYQAHRLAWLHFYGEWPKNRIDHKDRINHHNWIENLRPANDAQNSVNRGVFANNALGIRGVQIHKQSGKYRARIFRDGKHISLGLYGTPEEASAAYQRAAIDMYGEYAGGCNGVG